MGLRCVQLFLVNFFLFLDRLDLKGFREATHAKEFKFAALCDMGAKKSLLGGKSLFFMLALVPVL